MAKKKKSEKSGNNSIEKKVKKLYGLMKKENLCEVAIEEENGVSINLKRRTLDSKVHFSPETAIMPEPAKKEEKKDHKDYIHSPMNGVFYRAPAPGEANFVEEGAEIHAGATVCIIEAMKLMNEVQVERHCKIKKILVENGSAVKVKDPLFEISLL